MQASLVYGAFIYGVHHFFYISFFVVFTVLLFSSVAVETRHREGAIKLCTDYCIHDNMVLTRISYPEIRHVDGRDLS